MAIRKINSYYIPQEISEIKLWKDYPARAFETIFYAKHMAKSIEQEKLLYISDNELEHEMKSLWCQNFSSLSCMIGYPQTGKTTFLRYYIGNDLINVSGEGTVFWVDYWDIFEEGMDRNCFFLNRVNKIFDTLLAKFPQVKDYFETYDKNENVERFVDCFLEKFFEQQPEVFSKQIQFTNCLKKLFYILCVPKSPIQKIVFCIDGIEHIRNRKIQDEKIRFYGLLYSFLTTIPPKADRPNCTIHMLFSVSPYYYARLRTCISEVCDEYIHVILKNDINLERYLSKRIKLFCRDKEIEIWGNCRQQFSRISQKFGGKYDRMIKNLSFNNIGRCMELYARILTNRRWVIPKISENASSFSKEDYILNNITVIRAIVCGENEIFVNTEEGCVTNLLYNTPMPEKNYSILCLYIVCMFIKEQRKDREYRWGFSRQQVKKILGELFQGIDGIFQDIEEVIDYLLRNHVLDKVSDNVLEENIYLTPKGLELWNMLQSDSVFLEMCREDYYRQYDEEGCDNNPYSSYHLMQTMQQHELFKDLCRILEELVKIEQKYMDSVRKNQTRRLFENTFGGYPMVFYLLEGLKKSLVYSGLIDHRDVKPFYESVVKKVAEMENGVY